MLNNDFLKELIDLEPGGVMAYTPLLKILKRTETSERKEMARERLPTYLLSALQDDGCLHDIKMVSETYTELIPEIVRADKIIKSNRKLKQWVSYESKAYKNFIMELERRIAESVIIQKKELRGSRFRCLMLTSMPRERVAQFLTEMVSPFSEVDDAIDFWMPKGFRFPEEARLGKTLTLLTEEQRENIIDWWLKIQKNANVPNWDIISTCSIEEREGLILVEAKSYNNELKEGDSCGASNPENREQIARAIYEANRQLNSVLPEWSLSRDSHYQVSNRFAWAWKLASMGIPVILVYLGFLNANEMADKGQKFTTYKQWRDSVLDYTKDIVPREAWVKRINIGEIPLIPLICAADVNVDAKSIK